MGNIENTFTAERLESLVEAITINCKNLSLTDLNKEYTNAKAFLQCNTPDYKDNEITSAASQMMIRTIRNSVILFAPEKLDKYNVYILSKAKYA